MGAEMVDNDDDSSSDWLDDGEDIVLARVHVSLNDDIVRPAGEGGHCLEGRIHAALHVLVHGGVQVSSKCL